MACEPNDLISAARCFSCLSPVTLLEVQTYLLCQIVAAGGTGGGGEQQVFFGSGPPANSPTAVNAIHGDTDTGELYWWYDGVWH